MDTPEPTLDGWRAAVERLRSLILSALAGARTGNSRVAERRLERAQEEVTRLAALMDRADCSAPAAAPRSGNTAANRLYAAKLREAWLASLAVDREWYGEDVGTDGRALTIELMLRDVEAELRGPMKDEYD